MGDGARWCLGGLVGLAAVFAVIPAATSAPTGPGAIQPGNVPRDSVFRVAPGVFRVGHVTIDAARRQVSIPGRVNMSSGIVELLACGKRGKTHESVLVVDGEPYHIQVGLLLLGLEPTRRPLGYQGDPAAPIGDSVEVTVSWEDSLGRAQTVRGEELILHLRTRRPMARTHWVFVGSRVMDGRFLAQEEGSIITTFHDPATLVDNPLTEGGDDTIYAANGEVVPRVGTPVTVVIRAIGPPRKTARKE